MKTKEDLSLKDRLVLSLALLDWDEAKASAPDHPIFAEDDAPLRVDGIYGAFPTQADGEMSGVPFYFRARHGEWRLDFGEAPVRNPDMTMTGDDPSAGMMEDEDVMVILRRGAVLVRFLTSA